MGSHKDKGNALTFVLSVKLSCPSGHVLSPDQRLAYCHFIKQRLEQRCHLTGDISGQGQFLNACPFFRKRKTLQPQDTSTYTEAIVQFLTDSCIISSENIFTPLQCYKCRIRIDHCYCAQ